MLALRSLVIMSLGSFVQNVSSIVRVIYDATRLLQALLVGDLKAFESGLDSGRRHLVALVSVTKLVAFENVLLGVEWSGF